MDKKQETLQTIAASLVADRKGILAADQSTGTIDKQLEAIGVEATAENRRRYREMLFTTPGLEKYATGVILYDTTIRNKTADGTPFVDLLLGKGIVPIIKVDKSTVDFDGFAGEVVTQGLDDLDTRFAEYYGMGARAAKWRTVFTIGEGTPSPQKTLFDCLSTARYAKLAQKNGIVPIVEPEVLYSGAHSLETAEEVTTKVLKKLFEALEWMKVDLSGVILKSSMVLAGSEHPTPSSPIEVAAATIRTFTSAVPERVPGIVFLSGGQTPEQATANLNAIARLEQDEGSLPWKLAFSFSRGLESPAQQAWAGKDENREAAQEALLKRLELNSLADVGAYSTEMEA
jgi:fructose-bisphosphate aldolase, class I